MLLALLVSLHVSKFRHIVTNQHVVNKCKKITVGDSISKQIPAILVTSDKRYDLAILQTISMEMASADTKSYISLAGKDPISISVLSYVISKFKRCMSDMGYPN